MRATHKPLRPPVRPLQHGAKVDSAGYPTRMEFKRRTLMQIADLICGNQSATGPNHFKYRSSKYLTEFFAECDTDYAHDGSTRQHWVADTLTAILREPHPSATAPPESFSRVIERLMSKEDGQEDDPKRSKALAELNAALLREDFEAFVTDDERCYLHHKATQATTIANPNPHRPFSQKEQTRKDQLNG